MKVGDAVADALATEADGPIFGLMGDANMTVWDGLTRDSRTRMIHSRYDAAAILMADGYARATGRIGVATVTCGPGLANCANALLTAARAGTPLVVFTGEYAPFGKGALQAFDTGLFARACESGFKSLNDLDTLAEDLSEGFYMARTQHCPVVLSLPAKYWDADLEWSWDYKASSDFIQLHQSPQEGAVAKVTEQLSQAKRPVILCGRGAVISGARAEIERLGDRIGALLATSLLGKGFFDGHPYDLGISGSYSSAPTEKLMAEADFVLAIGASLNFFTTEGGMLFPNAKVARIDLKPFPSEIGVMPGLYIQGDARQSALALTRALESKGVQNEGFRTENTRKILSSPTPVQQRCTDGLDPRELMRVLSDCLPPNTQVTTDAGMFWNWPHAYLALPPGARYQHSCNFGSVGLGLAQGIGAAIGSPERTTLVIAGDGGLFQGIQELHVAAEYKMPLIVLVMNDAGYGAEVHKMNIKNQNPRDVVWQSPDFVTVARGLGGDGIRIEKESELAEAIKQGMEHKGPFLIDARIARSLTGDYYQRIYMGKENTTPLLRPVRVLT